MANIVMHRTRTAGTVTKTAIDQEQSLEMVQTMLHSSLSTLSYLRNFFPEKAFKKQVYTISESFHSYAEYAACNFAPTHRDDPDRSTTLQVLCRGRSKRADQLLDWLESGAFVALKAGNLRSLRVNVHTDRERRENVVETYTFNVKYAPSTAGAGHEVVGLEIGGPNSNAVSIGNTSAAVQVSLRKINKLCSALPDLPDKRYISMVLLYVHDTDTLDLPQGFVPNPSSSLFFAEAEGWGKRTQNFEQLQSGFHNVSLQITHLQKDAYQYYPNIDGPPPPALPQRLKYTNAVDRFQDPDAIQQNAADRVSNTPSTIAQSQEAESTMDQLPDFQQPHGLVPVYPPEALAATMAALDRSSEGRPHGLQFTGDAISSGLSQQDQFLNTQSSDVPVMKKSLQGMMQPEHMTQGDTQTQWFPPFPRSGRTETPCSAETSLSTATHRRSTGELSQPMLSQAVVKALDRTKIELRQTAVRLTKAQGTKKQSAELILCQCGSANEEGRMIMCVYCNTWQHLHCYGYMDVDDRHLPDDHVCYQCLLGGKEDQRLETLGELALKRRGMYLAEQDGLKTQREFAEDLDLQVSVARSIYNFLKDEGYVIPAGHGKGKAGKIQFVAVKEGSDRAKMLKKLFDPMTHISHHYDLPLDADQRTKGLHKQRYPSQTVVMPPPITPASRVLRKLATSSSTTGPGLRRFMLPFETPSRASSLPGGSMKRRGDEHLTGARSPKRQASLPNGEGCSGSQSKFLLDAGASSSPAPSTPAGSSFEL